MDMLRRHKPLQDQENLVSRNALAGKAGAGPGGMKLRVGLTQRGVLGDLSNNLPARSIDVVGKVNATAAEFEKKATISRTTLRSASYKHVQSKIDTGLSTKAVVVPQPSARPALRRDDKTLVQRPLLHRTKQSALEKASSKENIDNTKPEQKEKKALEENKARAATVQQIVTRQSKEKAQNEIRILEPASPQLPPDVEDVDAGDDNSPLLLSIYIKDIYRYLTDMEIKYSIRPDHLSEQLHVTGRMRATLVDWLLEVVGQFNLLLETFQLTVAIVDRYLQVKCDVTRDKLQLVGVSALFLASKYEEIYSPEVGDLVFVTDNAYTKRDVFRCERDIIQRLGFCFGRPLPLHFMRRFVKVADGNSQNHHLAKYFVDLSLMEYSLAHYRPSELAASAMCLSLYLLSNDSRSLEEIWTRTLQYYSGYTLDYLRPIITRIAKVVRDQPQNKLKAAQRRYAKNVLANVSTLPVLASSKLLDVANYEASSPPTHK